MGADNEIDKLFSSHFEKYHIPAMEDEWTKLHSDLKWVNFWKLQFHSFNIYYLAGILVIAAVITFFVITGQPSAPINPAPGKILDSIPVKNDSIIQGSVPVDQVGIPSVTVKNPENKAIHEENIKKVLFPDSLAITQETQPSIKADPVDSLKKEASVDTSKQQPRIRKVKRTTVVKAGTVTLRDTLDVVKKIKL